MSRHRPVFGISGTVTPKMWKMCKEVAADLMKQEAPEWRIAREQAIAQKFARGWGGLVKGLASDGGWEPGDFLERRGSCR